MSITYTGIILTLYCILLATSHYLFWESIIRTTELYRLAIADKYTPQGDILLNEA